MSRIRIRDIPYFWNTVQGDHTIVTYGFADILERLARPLNIKYNIPVDTITDNGDQIVVTDIAGQKFKADRCIVTGIGILSFTGYSV